MSDFRVPHEFLEAVAASYGPFSLDLGADPAWLERPWEAGRVWLEPPAGGVGARPWLEKAAAEAAAGATVVCLVPFAPDTAWWHELVAGRSSEVRPVRGRIRFAGTRGSAPFPSALVVYRPPLLARRPRPAPDPKPRDLEPPAPQLDMLDLFGEWGRLRAAGVARDLDPNRRDLEPGGVALSPDAAAAIPLAPPGLEPGPFGMRVIVDPNLPPGTVQLLPAGVFTPAGLARGGLIRAPEAETRPRVNGCVRCNGTGVLAPSKAWDFDDQREHDPCPVCCTHAVCPVCPASLQRLEAEAASREGKKHTAPAGPEP